MDLEYSQNIEIITLGIKKKAIVNILRDLMEKVDNTQEQIDDVSGDRKCRMPLMCSLVDWTEE